MSITDHGSLSFSMHMIGICQAMATRFAWHSEAARVTAMIPRTNRWRIDT